MESLQQFYNTQDSTLAALLELCGCQHPVNDRGQQIVCSNTFTAAMLKNITDDQGQYRYRGKMTAENAAIDAHKRNIEGIVIYHFETSENLKEICAGWEAMMDAMALQADENKKTGKHPDTQMPMDELKISHTEIGRLFCLYEKTRKDMFKRKRMIRPSLAIMETSTEITGENKTRTTGSCKIRSLKV